MADSGIREMTVTPYPYTGTPYRFAIVPDSQVGGPTSGKRAITRSYRDANASDPARRQRVQWEIWGAIGSSLESTAGGLGIDFVRDLETRWERRLTSAGAQTTVDLTSLDPPGEGAYFGTAYFGSSYFSSSGTSLSGGSVVVFAEQGGYLLVLRGSLLTQVDMSTDPWTIVSTTVLDAVARDADSWRGTVKIALGPNGVMQRVTGVSGTGVTLADVTATSPAESVYATAIKRGSDRIWYINANESQTTFNYANYAFDDFVNLASPFQVGDPEVGTTGIGPFGPFTQFGSEDGIYSFTNQGKPTSLSRALATVQSSLNGKQFADPGYAWNYYTSVSGLRANAGGTDNPVGIGERMRSFTGHNGLPSAVYQVRGELPVVYQTEAGDLYGYRCTFGPATGGTGQPLLWPWFYDASSTCEAIFSSTTSAPSQGIWLIRADGTNLTYELISANGRDDLYSSYEYSVAGGSSYLTTLDRDTNLRKTLRLARFRTRNMASGDSWTVAFAFDADPDDPVGASYVSLDAVTTDGNHTVVPDNGAATGQGNPSPTASISGFTIKPRITQVAGGAGSASTPPEMVGTLEVEYDERPEQVQDVGVVVNLTGTGYTDNNIWDTLLTYVGEDTEQPMRIQLPDNLPPGVPGAYGGQQYAFLRAVVNREDIREPGIEGVELQFTIWPQAGTL